jgi:ABC-type lipoprotein export system ATPase subunit
MTEPVLRIQNLTFEYRRNMPLIRDFSLLLNKNDKLMIDGVSGAGKSTLLNLIFGYLTPTSGTIILLGQDLSRISQYKMPYLRRKIGMITQFSTLLKDMTVIDNVAMPLFLAGHSKAVAHNRAEALLDRVRLGHKLHASVLDLSGGEEQRVSIARALSNQPSMILADEATANLDHENAENILQLCIEMSEEQGIPLIWTTHNPNHRYFFTKSVTLKL